jgi:septal ring factor EnvC (AmiA/AmiB activator)
MSFIRRALTFWIAAILAASSAMAEPSAKSLERSRQKESAEQERAELRKKLLTLKEDIGKTEKARGHAADSLAASEAAISNANRSLRELVAEQEKTKKRLEKLSVSQEALETAVAQQRNRLEKMLRGQYVSGQDDRVKLLLSGDNPNRIARELRYLGYVSAEQSKAIDILQQNLAAIEANKLDAEEARKALEDIADEQREQKALLEKEKNKRKALLSQLSTQLSSQRKQAGNLSRDEERLSSLVEKLAALIAQQRKAEEEEAKRRARAKAEQKEKLAAKGRAADKAAERPEAGPAKAASKPAPESEPEPPPANDGSGFASLRGKLKSPVKGELVASFGARRADGPNWKGLFIKAAEGAEVKTIAAGEIIFADWMGFGIDRFFLFVGANLSWRFFEKVFQFFFDFLFRPTILPQIAPEVPIN